MGRGFVVLLLSFFLAGCLEAQKGATGDTAIAEDTQAVPDSTAVEDVQPEFDSTTAADAQTDAATDASLPELACECSEGEVYRFHPCVPTLALGCGPSCTDDCGDGLACTDCAASSRCGTRDCRSACAVPEGPHALVPEPLRVSPTTLPAGAGGALSVEGTSFYVGALGHNIKLGDALLTSAGAGSVSECTASVGVPAETPAGAYPLWVSQYSGGEPWVLAGIVHIGDAPSCVQPGFPCATAAQCCTAPGVSLNCTAGRCQRP